MGRTDGLTDGLTDWRTDGRTRRRLYAPPKFFGEHNKQENGPNKFHVNFIDSSRHYVPDGRPEHCGVSGWAGPVFSGGVDAGVALRRAETPFTAQLGGRFSFATRAQLQQHQPQQQPQQQQQPQPQPQFRRPVCRTFQRFLISHCNISSIMIVKF